VQTREYLEGAGGNAITAEDGTYKIASLPSALYQINIQDAKNRWAAMSIPNISAVEGQITTVPDTTLSAGALIEGTVTEEKTGKPVPHVMMIFFGPESKDKPEQYADTDANGHYQFRIMPGKGSVKQWQPPQGYIWKRDLEPVPVETKLGETKELDFKLSKGLTVSALCWMSKGKRLRIYRSPSTAFREKTATVLTGMISPSALGPIRMVSFRYPALFLEKRASFLIWNRHWA
jgi:hypothetical protein